MRNVYVKIVSDKKKWKEKKRGKQWPWAVK